MSTHKATPNVERRCHSFIVSSSLLYRAKTLGKMQVYKDSVFESYHAYLNSCKSQTKGRVDTLGSLLFTINLVWEEFKFRRCKSNQGEMNYTQKKKNLDLLSRQKVHLFQGQILLFLSSLLGKSNSYSLSKRSGLKSQTGIWEFHSSLINTF